MRDRECGNTVSVLTDAHELDDDAMEHCRRQVQEFVCAVDVSRIFGKNARSAVSGKAYHAS